MLSTLLNMSHFDSYLESTDCVALKLIVLDRHEYFAWHRLLEQCMYACIVILTQNLKLCHNLLTLMEFNKTHSLIFETN